MSPEIAHRQGNEAKQSTQATPVVSTAHATPRGGLEPSGRREPAPDVLGFIVEWQLLPAGGGEPSALESDLPALRAPDPPSGLHQPASFTG